MNFDLIVTLSLSSQYSNSECNHNKWIMPVYTHINIATNITVKLFKFYAHRSPLHKTPLTTETPAGRPRLVRLLPCISPLWD